MNTKKDLFNFIETITNWVVNEKELHIKMPLYIKAAYELWNTEIAAFGVLFLKIKDSQVDMRIHQNAVKKIEDLGKTYKNALNVFVNPKVHHLSIEKYTTLSKKIIAPSATFQFL